MIEHRCLADIRAEADRIGLSATGSDSCSDPARAAMIAHFEAYTAMLQSTIAGDPDDIWSALSQAEVATRRELFQCKPPRSLCALADLVSYTVCFSLPDWSESDPEDELISLVKCVAKTLPLLVRQHSACGEAS